LRNAPAKTVASAIKSAKYFPNLGMFDSQFGNISFPTWEQILLNGKKAVLLYLHLSIFSSKHFAYRNNISNFAAK
jgi:hypothetical protein